jgi:hypothetical protein
VLLVAFGAHALRNPIGMRQDGSVFGTRSANDSSACPAVVLQKIVEKKKKKKLEESLAR